MECRSLIAWSESRGTHGIALDGEYRERKKGAYCRMDTCIIICATDTATINDAVTTDSSTVAIGMDIVITTNCTDIDTNTTDIGLSLPTLALSQP